MCRFLRTQRPKKALIALALWLVALPYGLWLQSGPRILDEGWSWRSSTEGLMMLADAHPMLFGLLNYPLIQLGASPQMLGYVGAALAALAVPLVYWTFGPIPALVLLFSPALTWAMGYHRHHALVLPVLALYLLALRKDSETFLLFTASLMALTHFQTQVILLATLPFYRWETLLRLILVLGYNPLAWWEFFRLFALVSGGVGVQIADYRSFLQSVFGSSLLAGLVGVLAGLGAWIGPLYVSTAAVGLTLTLFLAARAADVYSAPTGLLVAVLVGLGLERLLRRQSLLGLGVMAAVLLGLGSTAWEKTQLILQQRQAEARRTLEGPYVVHPGLPDATLLRLNGYEGIILCPAERLRVQ